MEDTHLEALTSLYNFHQLISELKHLLIPVLTVFASQCTPLDTNGEIPETQSYVTNSSVKSESTNISNITRSLDANKARGHDNILIGMLKICDSAIVEPLTIIFNSCINQSIFPDIWKKSNICPIHKRGDKQTISNYRPVSLLPVCRKIFERLIFNSLYRYLEDNKLL